MQHELDRGRLLEVEMVCPRDQSTHHPQTQSTVQITDTQPARRTPMQLLSAFIRPTNRIRSTIQTRGTSIRVRSRSHQTLVRCIKIPSAETWELGMGALQMVAFTGSALMVRVESTSAAARAGPPGSIQYASKTFQLIFGDD
jgi:hypothetical protein